MRRGNTFHLYTRTQDFTINNQLMFPDMQMWTISLACLDVKKYYLVILYVYYFCIINIRRKFIFYI